MTYAIAQALIVTLLVAWSTWFAARRLLPTASRRAQAHVATWIGGSSRIAWLQRLGHAIEPVQTASGGCGTSGCSTCGACAPVAHVEAQPLAFQARPKP